MAKEKKRQARGIPSKDLIQPREDPLYRKIFLALNEKILNGDFDLGRYLPSEHDLAESFGVSRITAKRALNDLAAAGLVVREKGRGTRVRIMSSATVVRGPQKATVERTPNIEGVRERATNYITLLDLRLIAAPREAAAALGIRPGLKIIQITRILNFSGLPYAHITAYLRPNLGGKWERTDLQNNSVGKLIEAEGIKISRTAEEISAIPAVAMIAKHLGIGTKSPVLKIVRTSFDAANTPTEYLIAYHPSDRYRYAVTSNIL